MSDPVDTQPGTVDNETETTETPSASADPAPDLELDCRGMYCPLPILRTKKAIGTLEVGQIVKMISTDPGSVPDVAAFSKITGHETLQHAEGDGEYAFWIRRSK